MSKYFLKHKNDWSNCCVCFMRLLFWFGIRVLLGDESRLRLQSSLTVAAKGSRHHRVEVFLRVEWERGWRIESCFDGALSKITFPWESKSPSWAFRVLILVPVKKKLRRGIDRLFNTWIKHMTVEGRKALNGVVWLTRISTAFSTANFFFSYLYSKS